MATSTAVRSSITLKGSAQMVAEFFHFGVHSILYQRGVYPADSFKREKKYGLSLLVSADDKVHAYLKPLFEQVQHWLRRKELRRLVLVLKSVQTKEPLERWQFDIQTDQEISETGPKRSVEKDEKTIRREIGDVMRQITASVAFLPLLEEVCSFDILIYTGKATDAPDGWDESDACLIQNGQSVPLRHFSTGVHKVEANVCYKMD